MTSTRELLTSTASAAADYLEGLHDRPIGARATLEELRAAIDVDLNTGPIADDEVVRSLRLAAEPGITAMGSGRYFGFVIGGALPAALAADWMTSTWDQNAGLYVCGPAAAVVEETAGRWLKDLLGIPAHASFAVVTGCQMAHFTALSAARLHVLDAVGWDVNEDGLHGAPPIRVVVGADRHVTVDRALRYLGIGRKAIVPVATDDNGRMLSASLAEVLASGSGPTIVCAQVGEVNTGAIDPMADVCDIAHAAGAWVHVDGAFGLWAGASDTHRSLVAGVGAADSWATDGHKWLNVPYDSGLAFCAHPASHRRALTVHADYLVHADDDPSSPREQMDWTPEFSRRARGFALYAALRSLGRRGVADLVDRSCAQARQFAAVLSETDGVEVVNDVMLNQVLVRFGDDAHTQEVLRRVQESGEAWMSGTVWRGKAAMRISVVNWQTNDDDVRRALAAIVAAHRAASETASAGAAPTPT